MTIEERAKEVMSKLHVCIENGTAKTPSSRIIDALTEQDHIAREEQQEEDICRAKKWLMEFLCDTDEENPILESLEQAIKND